MFVNLLHRDIRIVTSLNLYIILTPHTLSDLWRCWRSLIAPWRVIHYELRNNHIINAVFHLNFSNFAHHRDPIPNAAINFGQNWVEQHFKQLKILLLSWRALCWWASLDLSDLSADQRGHPISFLYIHNSRLDFIAAQLVNRNYISCKNFEKLSQHTDQCSILFF